MSRRSVIVVALAVAAIVAGWLVLSPRTTAPIDATASRPDAPDGSNASPHVGTSPRASAQTVAIVGKAIRDPDGAAIANATVMLRAHAPDDDAPAGERHRTIKTDAGGGFAFDDVAPGRYAISATAPGHLPAVVRRIDITASAPEPVTLRLASGGRKVHGTIDDITGGSIEGALVRAVPMNGIAALRDHEGFATLSDPEGAYALFVAPGRYMIEVSHPDYAARSHGVEVAGGDLQQDFQLVPTGSIEGTVVEENGGAPIANARVSWSHGSTRGTVIADERGRFALRGLQPGTFDLSARASKRASLHPISIPVALAEHVTDVELTVVAAFDIGGRVVDARDRSRGIAGAHVQITSLADRASATADADGRFVVHGVLPGKSVAVANAERYGSSFPGNEIDVESDRDDVEIALEPGRSIRGRVDPPEVAQVSLELRPGAMQMGRGMIMVAAAQSVESDDDGTFEIMPVQPGPAVIVARTADGRVGETTVEVGPDGADDVIVRLENRVRVRGTVRGTNGAPISQALVSLKPVRSDGHRMTLKVNGREMGVDSSVTADDGSFEIVGLQQGEYELSISDRHWDALPVRSGAFTMREDVAIVEIPDRDVDGLELVVDAHDGEIRGTVRSDDGSPAADVWVTLTRRPDPIEERPARRGDGPPREESHHEMRIETRGEGGPFGIGQRAPVLTGEDGSFHFTGLRDGEYDVVAEAGGGRSRVSDKARPGDVVNLKLAPLAKVEGEVTLNHAPLKDFVVTLQGPTSRTVRVRDNGGHFEIDRLDPGEYQLTVRALAATGDAKFTAAPGRTVTRDIVMTQLATVIGTIVGDDDTPLSGVMVMIGNGSAEDGRIQIQQGDGEPLITTDAEGKFEAHCSEGARVLVGIEPGKPRPIVGRFFTAKAGERLDLGTLSPTKDGLPRGGPPAREEEVIAQ